MFACCDESGTHVTSQWWALGAMWLPEDSRLPQYEANATRLFDTCTARGEQRFRPSPTSGTAS